MNTKHLFSLSLTLVIVMLFSALGPTTVYADDGAPPDTTTVEAPQTDGETGDEGDAGTQTDEVSADPAEAVATEEVATEPPADESGADPAEAVATEEIATEPPAAEAVATEEVATEPPADESGAGESGETATEEPGLMEQLPDNTEVVVINAEGEAEPLATQEAADAVVASDPIWCPAGAGPDSADCTDPFPSFTALFEFLQTSETDVDAATTYNKAGTIFVEMGNYGGSESSITFNPDDFTYLDANPLTIQGGWNTSDNTTTATTTFDVPMVIGSSDNPWGGSLTLNNIIISGVVGDVGLTVHSAGDVTIENSTFNDNDDAGVVVEAGGDVTVRNSNVTDNGSNDWNVVDGRGLEIKSGGYVTLNGVIANDNQLSGADIVAEADVAIANSTFNGNLMYTTNWAEFFGYGLTVVSQGDIALSAVEANENFLWGASLTGSNVYIEDSFFNRNVTDSTSFIDDTGLIIVTTGAVALDNIQANENRLIGADIKADGQVDIQDSSFDRNFGTTVDASGADVYHGYGLNVAGNVNAAASIINLDVVTADENYLFGANLFASGDVNISGSSFSNNVSPAEQGYGLMIDSGGAVELLNVVANENGQFGANIQATDYIEIEDSIFSNNLNSYGLWTQADTGYITLTNVNALGNAGDGAYADTTCVYLDGGAYTGNDGYGLNVPNGFVDETSAPTYSGNGLGATNPNPFSPCQGGGVVIIVPAARSGAQYTAAPLTQSQLPAALGQGNTFVSALKVTSQAANLAIELSFPVPAGMEGANLVVMFWDGTQWVEVPGGSLVNGEFVITVTQPGIYVLVSR
jgi:parallel beta-helix repeat protein